MKKYKIVIVFFIIIILISVFLNKDKLSDKNEKKGSLNKIFSFIFNKQGNSILKLDSKPNYSNENYTEFMYKKLNKELDRFNHKSTYGDKQIKLDGKCDTQTYIHSTMDKFLKDELNQITNKVLEELNDQCSFDFAYSGYGDIRVITDKESNKNYIYELFVWDKENYFQIKLNVNLIKYVDKRFIPIEDVKDNNNLVFKYYPIGIPSKEQLIPTAMDVIPTANEVLSRKSIKYPVPSPIKYILINSINIRNADWILNYDNKNKDTLCGGYSDGSMEYSKIKGDCNPYIEPAVIRNKWPRLFSQPYNTNTWPCTPEGNNWNMLGIYQPPVNDSKECPGKTLAAQYVYPQPNYNPTIATLPRNCGENFWLFDLTNATGAVASSASQPPP